MTKSGSPAARGTSFGTLGSHRRTRSFQKPDWRGRSTTGRWPSGSMGRNSRTDLKSRSRRPLPAPPRVCRRILHREAPRVSHEARAGCADRGVGGTWSSRTGKDDAHDARARSETHSPIASKGCCGRSSHPSAVSRLSSRRSRWGGGASRHAPHLERPRPRTSALAIRRSAARGRDLLGGRGRHCPRSAYDNRATRSQSHDRPITASVLRPQIGDDRAYVEVMGLRVRLPRRPDLLQHTVFIHRRGSLSATPRACR